jgi:methionyl-tRNA formyltransferase
MALRKIVVQGEECLTKVCRPVTEFNPHLHQLLDDMLETLEDANGAGLAAPQVGVLRRVCVVLDEDSEEYIELVNPEIVAQSGEQTGLEGCLSVPGKWGIVTRPDVVRVRAQDRYGDWFEVEGEGRPELSATRSSIWTAICLWSTSTTSSLMRSSGTIWSRRSGRPVRPQKLRKGSEPMRILFMGTPDFAVASLRRLVADGHEVCGVFTQPDKPKNRGHKLVPTPVKGFALTENIPVYQPLKMRDGTALELVQSLAPELTVVAAYGRILPEDILEAPRYGSINVHSSLLPKYRGAAPINWAILNGDETTGVSIMYMAKELDAGDVILQKETPIGPDEDAQALTVRLADLGAEALSEAVAAIGNGTAARTPQDESRQTYASMLTKEMSPIDWTRSAREIDCQVRGLIPWPCAACELAGQRFKVYRTAPGEQTGAAPGTVLSAGKQGIQVACGRGESLYLTEIQAEGGKRMAAASYLLGHPLEV